jgi:transaldolase
MFDEPEGGSDKGQSVMPSVSDLRVKLFADGADLQVIRQMAANPLIKGFTTNPTLMRKAGIVDYTAFARAALALVPDRPISFEAFSDDFDEMAAQALEIASWGPSVFVKIPVTNTRGEFAGPLISHLTAMKVQVNVTAVMTTGQVADVARHLRRDVASFVSIFAGRIADTGRDPMPIVAAALRLLESVPAAQVIWASPRELLNVFQADQVGCHVITATSDVLNKLPLVGKDLTEFSLETVRMFRNDAVAAAYDIPVTQAGRIEAL